MSQEELHQLLTSEEVSQRPLRDRVGIWIDANNAQEAISKIREAEQTGVQQIWSQNAGLADVMTIFAAVVTQTERIRQLQVISSL